MNGSRFSTVAGLALVALLAAPGGSLVAQEQEGGGAAGQQGDRAPRQTDPYLVISHYRVDLADAAQLADNVRQLVAAAREAELPADFQWSVWREGDDFFVVSPRQDLASLEDPEAFMRAFEGTPGQQRLQQAMQGFQGLDMEGRSYVLRSRPEWSYTPEQSPFQDGPGGVFLIREWLNLGGEQAFDQNQRQLVSVLEEMGYPYPVEVYEVLVGELGQVEIAIVFDDLEQFHGARNIEKLLAAAGSSERWEGLMNERHGLVRAVETRTLHFQPELSYGMEMETAGQTGEGGSD